MSDTIENLFNEERSFPPPYPFARMANAQPDIYGRAESDSMAFWEEEARKLEWREPWTQTLDESNAPFYQWFIGGKLNATESCLDRHLDARAQIRQSRW